MSTVFLYHFISITSINNDKKIYTLPADKIKDDFVFKRIF